MDKRSTHLGLTVARVGAVVVAVAALAYFVINAQQNAQSSPESSDTPPSAQPDTSSFEGAPPPTRDKPRVFLPSSKSLPLSEHWSSPEAKADEAAPKPKREEKSGQKREW